jgi:chitinase
MHRKTRLAVYVASAVICAGFLDGRAQAQSVQPLTTVHHTGKRMAGYFTDWAIYSGYYAKNLVTNGSAGKLTHILYAFANVPPQGSPGAGTCQIGDPWADYEMPIDAADSVDGAGDGGWGTLRGNFNQLLKLKTLYPGIKILISLGGWSWSSGFSAAASTEASRQALVSSCVDMFIRGNFLDPANYNITQAGLFDGIDIDWEYPGACGNTCDYSPDDTQNFTLLLAEFRRQLDVEGARNKTHYLLSIAAPAGSVASNIQLTAIHPYLDFVNLMTYDIHGGWDDHADHAAPLFTSPFDPLPDDKEANADAAVSTYLAAGIPPLKLNLGIPFYGHGWITSGTANHGLYQPATGTAPLDQAGYAELQALTGFVHHYDPLSGMAHWIFKPSTREFYSYDDPTAVFAKALYIRSRTPHGLGGAMFWELSTDDAAGTLVKTLYSVLH